MWLCATASDSVLLMLLQCALTMHQEWIPQPSRRRMPLVCLLLCSSSVQWTDHTREREDYVVNRCRQVHGHHRDCCNDASTSASSSSAAAPFANGAMSNGQDQRQQAKQQSTQGGLIEVSGGWPTISLGSALAPELAIMDRYPLAPATAAGAGHMPHAGLVFCVVSCVACCAVPPCVAVLGCVRAARDGCRDAHPQLAEGDADTNDACKKRPKQASTCTTKASKGVALPDEDASQQPRTQRARTAKRRATAHNSPRQRQAAQRRRDAQPKARKNPTIRPATRTSRWRQIEERRR